MIDQKSLLDGLTEPQRQAVTHVDGPILIIAGPGSGKTRVITRRVAHLISLGIPAQSILAITFTNKAAGEMKARVEAVVGRKIRDFGKLDQPWPTICTFHSLCLRILRHYAAHIGLAPNFTIYDSADQTRALKEALKTLEISSTNFSPAAVHSTISNAKNQLITADAYAQSAHDFYGRTIARVFTKYQQILTQNNAMDFDDLILRCANVFRDHPDVLADLQQRFQYVMIDEYQDTNHAQYVLAHALALKHRNICVVGDPDQSIYAWRGADIQNILEFEQDYKDAVVVRLEQNYRSTKTILEIADALISHNTQRKAKALLTDNPPGEKAKLFLCPDEYDEAAVIVQQLKQANATHGIDWDKMAVFYRMNSLSRVLEKALFDANVPYQIARGVEFYNRKEIKDVLAYLRVIANPADEVSLTRIINVPTRGIGDSSVKQIQTWGLASGIGLWDAMQRVGEVEGLSTRAVKSVQQFVEMLTRWQAAASEPARASVEDLKAKGRVQSLMEDVVRLSGIEALLKKEAKAADDYGDDPLGNVNQLINSSAEYDSGNPEGSLHDYLSLISLVSDADHMKGNGGTVTLMTLHAAKGLEFPLVAMIGLEDGCLPHARARDNPSELEEERRLCFVGITRAEKFLILTKAGYRTMRGMRERTITSPFLSEMPPQAFDIVDRGGGQSFHSRDYDYSMDAETEFKKGQRVRHPTFGIGRIAEISQSGSNTRAIIEFNQVGRKTLILEYAKLEPVG